MVFEKTKTVLVVGKQPKEIAYLTKRLSIAGYASLLARTGAGAIKATKEHAPDVVFLEIDLPDMEGVDVVRAPGKPGESRNTNHCNQCVSVHEGHVFGLCVSAKT